MVILHTEDLKNWGGQQNRVLTECIGLDKRGHKMIIACHKGSMLAQKSKMAGIKTYELNMVKQAHLLTIPKLIRIIKEEKVDIVATHSSVDSWAGGIAAKFAGRKLIRFRHNLYPVGRDPLTRLIYFFPDRIIAISEAIRDVLVSSGLKGEDISVVHSAVNIEKFNQETDDLKNELGIPGGTVVIGNTSTFTRVKGQDYLMQAFNIICVDIPCILLFAGRLNESARAKYLSYVNEELRHKVIFLGHREDIPKVLKTIDIFVYPSYLEGLGTALLEAMAMERPVVVSDIPTFRNFIKDGINGIFFKPKDVNELYAKVRLLMKEIKLRKQIGENARATIIERFTIDNMVKNTEAVYMELFKEK